MRYNQKADMWSFGILMGQLCSVDLVYPYGNRVTWENIKEQVRCTWCRSSELDGWSSRELLLVFCNCCAMTSLKLCTEMWQLWSAWWAAPVNIAGRQTCQLHCWAFFLLTLIRPAPGPALYPGRFTHALQFLFQITPQFPALPWQNQYFEKSSDGQMVL